MLLICCVSLLPAFCACMNFTQMQLGISHSPPFFPSMCWHGCFLNNALSSFRFCNENSPCPLPIFWSSWGPWNKCSVNCGGGIHSRQRSCENGNTCPGCAVVCIVYCHCIRGTYWHWASRDLVFNSSLHLGFISQAKRKLYPQLLLERMLKWTGKQRSGGFPESMKLACECVCVYVCACVCKYMHTQVRTDWCAEHFL